MVAEEMAWVSEGKGTMCAYPITRILHDSDGPEIVVDMTDGMIWRFTFPNTRKGNGAIIVGNGCRYNPLKMIEQLWRGFEDGHFGEAFTPTADIDFNEDAVADGSWAKNLKRAFGDDLE